MNYIYCFWSKLKIKPDIWFFYEFLLTFTFSIRKVLFYFPIKGTFNEYTGIYVYISDIFLFFTMLSWIILILSNKNIYLSNCKLWITQLIHSLYCKIALELKFIFFNRSINLPNNYYENSSTDKVSKCSTHALLLSNVSSLEKCSTWNITWNKHGIFIIIPLVIVIWSFISIIWSSNQTIAVFRSIKLFEYFLLYSYIAFRLVPFIKSKVCSTFASQIVPRGTIFMGWNSIMVIIIIIGLFQSIIGIIHFIDQHSIGLFWLKESIISPDIAGVAKIVINGQKYIRAYGLFPHPNILGGFLLFSIIITLMYYRMFHACRVTSNCSTPAPFNVPRGTILNSLILVQSIAFFLTFSKSAILGLTISLFYMYIAPHLVSATKMFHPIKLQNVPHGTIGSNGAGVEHFKSLDSKMSLNNIKHDRNLRIALLIFLIIILTFYLSWTTVDSMIRNSIEQRIIYLNVSRGTILANPVLGIGMGQFVPNMQKYTANLELWQFQPVHNVFLLIWSELGIVGLGFFTYWMYKMFHMKHKTLSPLQGEGWDEVNKVTSETNDREVANSDKSILQNKSNSLSSGITLRYFKAILLGFIFIMLFDHYFWDIQQGNIMLWMTMGFIAGLNKNIT